MPHEGPQECLRGTLIRLDNMLHRHTEPYRHDYYNLKFWLFVSIFPYILILISIQFCIIKYKKKIVKRKFLYTFICFQFFLRNTVPFYIHI